MSIPPFMSEGMRQDLVTQGWCHDPTTNAVIARQGWTPPEGRGYQPLRDAMRDGWIWNPQTGAITRQETEA